MMRQVRRGVMSEVEGRFYAGCILLAFEHLHAQSLVYRDLKPENVVFDKEGSVRRIDLRATAQPRLLPASPLTSHSPRTTPGTCG